MMARSGLGRRERKLLAQFGDTLDFGACQLQNEARANDDKSRTGFYNGIRRAVDDLLRHGRCTEIFTNPSLPVARGYMAGWEAINRGANVIMATHEIPPVTVPRFEAYPAPEGQRTSTAYTVEELDDTVADLMFHMTPDERDLKSAVVGYMGEPAALLATDKRVLWRFLAPDAPVLSLNFRDVWEVRLDGALGVLLTYRPTDFPHELRLDNPNGELDAEFMFQRGDEEVRQLVLNHANGAVRVRATGATLATGEAYLTGVLRHERYRARVEAHQSAMALHVEKMFPRTFPYSAAAWFRVGSVPPGLWFSDLLGVGNKAIQVSLTGEGMEDRLRLVIKSDDLEQWRVILENFGVGDTGRDQV
jgi:hypothetical protein